MQRFSKAVALLLCLVMLLGILPAGALAADTAAGEVVDAAIIFSDLHTSSSDYKESTLKGIMTALNNTGLPFSSVTSAGDAFSVNADSTKYTGYTSTLTGYIQDVLGEVPVNYVWSDHDRYALQADDKTLLDNDSGLVYGAGEDGQYGTNDDANYYIFELSMADLSTNNRYNADFHTNAEVTQAIADFTAAAANLKKDRPLFIASHQPLLDRRTDNGHAYEWATAINEVALTMDVAFFFGHNHRYDVEKDYYYGKGETMSVCSDSSGNAKNVTLNFTHMCAGYMAPSSTGSTSNTTRQGVAVAITIYDDAINYTTYNSSGVYTGNYALNETVDRAFAASEPETPETEPTVPETTVPAVTEPEIVELTDDATRVTVAAPAITGLTVTVLDLVYDTGAYSAYASYDIELEGYTDGDKATVSIPVDGDFDANRPVQVLHDGKVIATTRISGGMISFTTDHFSVYDVAQTAVVEGEYAPVTSYSPGGVTLEVQEMTVYKKVNTPVSGKQYLIVSSANGTGNGLNNNLGGYTTNAFTGGSDYYTSWDNASQSGTAFSAGSDVYLTADHAYLWTATQNGSTWSFGDGSIYVGWTHTKKSSYSRDYVNAFAFSSTAQYWSLGTNQITVNLMTYDSLFGSDSYSDYYLAYHNNEWTMAVANELDSTNVYFYEPVTIYKVVETVTPAGIFSIAGNPDEHNVVGKPGSTLALNAELTFETENGETTVTDVTSAAKFEIVSGSEVATISGNTLTMTGDTGTVVVKVTHKTDAMENKVVNYIFVNVEEYVQLDWELIYNPSGKTYYVLADTIVPGENYLIASKPTGTTNSPIYVMTSSGGAETATYNSSTARIESSETNNEWTIESASSGYTFKNASTNRYFYLNGSHPLLGGSWTYDLVTGSSSAASMTVDNLGSGGYRISRKVSSNLRSTTVYLRYNNGFGAVGSANTVYLFRKVHETGSQLYGAMKGKTSYTYHIGNFDSNEELLEELKKNIHVYTATKADGSDAVEDLNYTFSGTLDCGTVGTYTLTVSTADGHKVGEVTVNIIAEPYLQITENDQVVVAPIMRKNVKVGDTIELGVEAFDGNGFVDNASVTWRIAEGYEDMATVDANGVVTVRKVHGPIWVEAEWVIVEDGTTITVTDMVLISVTDSSFFTPADGTNDFPEFPEKGSIRFDKTSEGVGNFSNTGIAEVELSMTGIPASVQQKLDVVLMLDHSNSMTEARMEATRAAVEVFVANIVKNEDGTFNGNRVYIGSFAGGNPDYAGQSRHEFRIYEMTTDEENGFQIINDQQELDALIENVHAKYYKFSSSSAPYGTEYAQSLQKCYEILEASKEDGNKQFTVFMSDGIPNVYQYGAGENDKTTSSAAMAEMFTPSSGTKGTRYTSRGSNYKYEYWSSLMKQNGVTVYTVGLGLFGTNSSLNGADEAECERVSNFLLNDISGPAGEVAADRDSGTTITKKDQYFFSVEDAGAASDMADVFADIATQMSEAATDVVVTDKIDPHYTVIFDVPQGTKDVAGLPEGQTFYIEVVDYPLDAYHDRITADGKSVFKLCLKDSNGTAPGGTYSAVDGDGNAYSKPVFQAASEGKKAFWSIVDANYQVQPNDIVVQIDGTSYKFMELGDGAYNVVSGAYAYGTINEENMSEDLVLITPYFAYSARTRMLAWTADKLAEDSELALKYFVYLNDSATEVGTDNETEPGPYPTNEWAYITYENFNGNDCRQEFPIPQQTWNGAQVSYVFYLVNEYGEPINKSGQVVDFANAVFVTDVFTEHVIWNKEGTEGASELNIQYLAKDKLSDAYTLYDDNAEYAIHVFQEENGTSKFNYFIIDGSTEGTKMDGHTVMSADTTKVYNTKAGERFSEYGTYSDQAVGSQFTTKDAGGNTVTITTDHEADLDYADTTVAFAVLWMPRLAPDVVVVDYGLDVLINVVMNDSLQNSVSGIGTEFTGNAAENTGVYVTAKLGMENLNIDGNTVSIENENQVRFHQGDMEFEKEVKFYYESPVTFTEGGNSRSGYMYSSVTVIPATTIYYEDDFLTLKSYNADGSERAANAWVNPDDADALQAQDRPGPNKISAVLDADNNYGYDAAYANMSRFSLDSSAGISVDANTYGTAAFSFYGTGFDVISLTSNQTGNIVVKVAGPDSFKKLYFVDTFYGYARGGLLHNTYTFVSTEAGGEWKLTGSERVADPTTVPAAQIGAPVLPKDPAENQTVEAYEYEWNVVDSNDPNALYQVPVMKIEDLPYGKYDVTITASYVADYDHANDGSYDFYLDAIRIYDPANDGKSSAVIEDAYKADHEYLPEYYELRNLLIFANSFSTLGENKEVNGIVFIDGAISTEDFSIGAGPTASVTDYSNYGPNNELYLAPGQAVAFNLDAGIDAPDGYVVDTVQIAYKSVGGTAKVKIWDAAAATASAVKEKTVATATDLYYDITALDGKTVVILNSGASTDPILSITNVKVTFKEAAPTGSLSIADLVMGRGFGASPMALMAAAEPEAEEETAITLPFTVTIDGTAAAIAALTGDIPAEPEETVPETTVPGETVPETTEPEQTEPEPEAFEPELFHVRLNKTTLKVGQKVLVTVTTSADVDHVIINGTVVTNYTTGYTGNRTFKLNVTASETGIMKIRTVCCNENDVASEAVTKQVMVQNKNVWDYIRDLLD